jgi:hypothetical protein
MRKFTFWITLAAIIFAVCSPASAQNATDITIQLSPAEVVEIARLSDLAAPGTFNSPPPEAYWSVLSKLSQALAADPAAFAAVQAAAQTTIKAGSARR